MKFADRSLARRLRQRDRGACQELIQRYHQAVFGYLRSMGADQSLADDLTQETYAKAWKNIDRLKDARSARAWLLSIARNELRQWARRRQPELMEMDELKERDTGEAHPDEQSAQREQDQQLASLICRLDAPLREVVVLHYFQGLSLREAGGVQGVPAGTIKSRLNRALVRLRELLPQEHHEGRLA